MFTCCLPVVYLLFTCSLLVVYLFFTCCSLVYLFTYLLVYTGIKDLIRSFYIYILFSYVTFSTKLYRELYAELRDTLGYRGYKDKPVFTWDIRDVQDWLGSLGIHERYRVSFEENEIDGYLLKSLKECDMLEYLNVDNKITRQKVFHSLRNVLERETTWDKSCQNRRIKDNHVYLVCDPVDVWIAEFIKSDLVKIGIMASIS